MVLTFAQAPPPTDGAVVDTAEQVYISSLALLKVCFSFFLSVIRKKYECYYVKFLELNKCLKLLLAFINN